MTAADLPLIATWLAEPHMAEWWSDVETELAEIASHIGSESVDPFIIELDGTPIGYLQSYDPHREQAHPYQDQPVGTIGLDLSIGVPDQLGRGHGSASLRQFVDQLFVSGTRRVVIDPDPTNARAIRAYEKAGFRPFDTRTTIYGAALMMARDADPETAP